MALKKKLLAAAVLTAACVQPALAQDSDGFRAPSGNIHCMYFSGDGQAALRCDIQQISGRPPARPRDCDLEYGKAFEVMANAQRAARICHGDTVADPNLRVLAYGQAWARGGFTCTSAETGITCRNARGAGFELSRANQRVF